MRQSEFFPAPYFNGIRPKSFLKETRDLYTRKTLVSGTRKSFNKDFGKRKPKI